MILGALFEFVERGQGEVDGFKCLLRCDACGMASTSKLQYGAQRSRSGSRVGSALRHDTERMDFEQYNGSYLHFASIYISDGLYIPVLWASIGTDTRSSTLSAQILLLERSED